jgi:hypothetical protein
MALLVPKAAGLNNGLALRPPMGWNTWNAFHLDSEPEHTQDAGVPALCWSPSSKDSALGLLQVEEERLTLCATACGRVSCCRPRPLANRLPWTCLWLQHCCTCPAVSEEKCRRNAELMQELGLVEAGYTYLILDGRLLHTRWWAASLVRKPPALPRICSAPGTPWPGAQSLGLCPPPVQEGLGPCLVVA